MRVTVKFSSLFKTLAGVEEDVLDVDDGTTVAGLSRILGQKYGKLPLEGGKAYFQINGQISMHGRILAEGDQVHVFRLLGGG